MLWFHCDTATGEILTAGVSPDQATAELQQPPGGASLVVVPDGAVSSPFSEAPDFSVLKALLAAKIDAEAGAIRSRFITDVPGQAQTYERKEREARAWIEGGNDADFPFLATEASVRGIATSVVQAEVMAQVNALTPLAALIEAHRMAAKIAVASGTTLPAIVNAAAVDWATVVGG